MHFWKDYLRQILWTFWHALALTDTLVIGTFILAGILAAFGFFGGHAEHPAWWIAGVIFLISLIVLLVRMPYTLYAKQRADIASLNQRLIPRIHIFVKNNGVREESPPKPRMTKAKRIQIGVSCATDAELEDCEAWLLIVKKQNNEIILEEKVNCVWSISETTILNLRPHLEYYANIFYVFVNLFFSPNQIHILPLTKPDNERLRREMDEPGIYYLQVGVSAKGVTKTALQSLIFDCRDYDRVSLTMTNNFP
jgi:uncharacterized membrane protein YtjA (UPF0391 family)